MKKPLLLLLALTIHSTMVLSQYLSDCTPISNFSPKSERVPEAVNKIQVNAAGEVCLLDGVKLYKRNKAGSALWSVSLPETGVTRFFLDQAGNVYARTYDDSSTKIYKYLSNGTLAWPPISLVGLAQVSSFTVDASGNLYLVGSIDNTPVSSQDIFIMKYNAAGVFQWEKTIDGGIQLEDFGKDIVVNAAGEVVVTASITLDEYGTTNSYTFKLNASGTTILWSKKYNYNALSQSLYLDPAGNVVLVIYFDEYSSRLIKLSGTGTQLGDVVIDVGYPVLAFSGSNTYVFGNFGEYLTIFRFNATLESSGHLEKLDFFFLNDFTFDYSTAQQILVDSQGDLIVCGNYKNTEDSEEIGFVRKFKFDGQFFQQKWEYWSDYGTELAGMSFDADKNIFISSSDGCLTRLTLCENLAPVITKEPVNATVCSGVNAVFQVAATGRGLKYQWKKGTTLLSNSSKFSGVNTASLTILKANETDDKGTYQCEVFDACNNLVKAKAVTLGFISPAAITAHPQNISQCTGTEAVFQVTATGGQNIKYQWKLGAAVLNDGASFTGTKTNKLTVKNIAQAQAGEYFCEVTSDCYAAAPSQKAVLTVLQPMAITSQPAASTSVCTGSTTSLSLVASGSDLVYQWRKNGVNLSETTAVTGTKTNTLTVKQIKSANAGTYTCVVSGKCGSAVTSANAVVAINTGSAFTEHPSDKVVCSGESATFSVKATGTNLVYTWKKGNTALANGGKYNGVATPTLSVTGITAAESGAYTCTISNACGNDLISAAGSLTLSAAPAISAISPAQNVCAGVLAKFSVTVPAGVFSYQWRKNGVLLSDGAAVAGSKSRELFINGLIPEDAGDYTCEVSAGCGTPIVSGVMKLEVTHKTAITSQAGSGPACESEDIVLGVTASGSTLTYQWKKNGQPLADGGRISGAKTKDLKIRQAISTDEGAYTCDVSGNCGIATAEIIRIVINPKPQLVLQPVIDCVNFSGEWSALVTDTRNIFGDYLIFKTGTSLPLGGLYDIGETGNYTIVKTTGVCADSVQWNNTCIVTGIGSDAPVFSISPNPTTGTINVRYTTPLTRFGIFNTQGRTIFSGDLPGEKASSIDATELSNGLYFITVEARNGKRISQRIIIQR